MKTLLVVLAAEGLSGCAVYPASSYDGYATGSPYVQPYLSPYVQPYPAPYVVTPPLYLHGGMVYRRDAYPRVHPGNHHWVDPRFVPHPSRHPGYGSRPRDRDRDGIPNRQDRDRDGDGTPNRADRWPNDPGRS